MSRKSHIKVLSGSSYGKSVKVRVAYVRGFLSLYLLVGSNESKRRFMNWSTVLLGFATICPRSPFGSLTMLMQENRPTLSASVTLLKAILFVTLLMVPDEIRFIAGLNSTSIFDLEEKSSLILLSIVEASILANAFGYNSIYVFCKVATVVL